MKKNILFVQSLLLLSLAATSPLMAGKKNKRQRQANRQRAQQKRFIIPEEPAEFTEKELAQIQQGKQNHTERMETILQELMQSELSRKQNDSTTPYHTIATNSLDTAVILDSETPNLIPSSNLLKSEVEIINVSMPECMAAKQEELNPLWNSVIIPTEKKELSFFEKISYYTSTANQILQGVIADLETGAFDVKYGSSFDLLNEAIETAIKNKDVKSLMLIAALSQKKYATSIRIPETVAQPAFELLKTHYTTEFTLTNEALQKKHAEKIDQINQQTAVCMTSILNMISAYQQNIKNIRDDYNTTLENDTKCITDLRRDVSTFSTLNREIRPGTAELLKDNQLNKHLNNVHYYTMRSAEQRLASIAKDIDNMPKTTGLAAHIKLLTDKPENK